MASRLGPGARRAVSALLVALLTVGVWWLQSRDDEPPSRAGDSSSVEPREPGEALDPDGIPYVDLADLPPQAADVMAQIDDGGPFAHPDKDGSTFGNREGLLPDRSRGYYAEYTVPTPGEHDRGARRIVAGDGGERYWTEDHYESFERIRG
ncbi:ribonuclease domain-containing protein [Nocardioides caeni]|uniref:Ribonuclease n=1 Tax=Nocardioides caeni TaxID=574700 RepID=A0A4S8NTS4_9ACTN|nr:ribonuclease domain-containing protein [Nocardioides caeni]THV18529.1 ribonuclease [Nocardioides caeni]